MQYFCEELTFYFVRGAELRCLYTGWVNNRECRIHLPNKLLFHDENELEPRDTSTHCNNPDTK